MGDHPKAGECDKHDGTVLNDSSVGIIRRDRERKLLCHHQVNEKVLVLGHTYDDLLSILPRHPSPLEEK